MAKSRRTAREAVLRALYQLDVLDVRADALEVLREVEDGMALDAEQRPYAEEMITGIKAIRSDLDREIASRIADYDWDRVAVIDRNVLRIAAYELLHIPWLAPAVTINEAVEIAKKYSTAESGRFVNGVLGRMARESGKADWRSTDAESEPEQVQREPEDAVVVEEVDESSPEAADARRWGWKLRSEG